VGPDYRTMRPTNRTTPPAAPEGVAAASWGDTLAIGAAVGAYGLSYGVLATAAGLSPLVATLSSLLVLAGGSQFAFVAVLAAGGNPLTGAVGGLLLNLRYAVFGLAVAQALPRGPLPRRLADAYLVVDESVALALGAAARGASPTVVTRTFRRIGLAVSVAWIGMTGLGAFGGQLIGDPRALGLDAAFPAGFLALLAPWLRTPPARRAAVAGALLAVALTPLTPPGVPIIAAALGALAGLVGRPSGTAAPGSAAAPADAEGIA
jgi:predicted branched-subunit amino acid permease